MSKFYKKFSQTNYRPKVKHESLYLIQLRSVLQNSSFGSFRLLHSPLGHFEQSTMIRGSQEPSYEQNKIKYEDSYAHEWLHHHGHRMMAPAHYIWNYIISVLACTGANVRPSGDSSLAECAWIHLLAHTSLYCMQWFFPVPFLNIFFAMRPNY